MPEDKKVQGDFASFSIFDITEMLLAGRKTAYVSVESGTFSRLQQMTQEADGDRVGRLLADLLHAVVSLPTRRPHETVTAEVLILGREEQSRLRKRDFGALRVQHAMSTG